MVFKKISCADLLGLPEWSYDELAKLSQQEISFVRNYPKSNEEIIENIGDADCALVSWNTVIDRQVIECCPNLRYIGMCCSLIDEQSANVDIASARKHGITVKGVRDYGDEGVIEFILSELIRLLKGQGEHQWKSDQVELGGQKIGIVGMGTTGKMLAEVALFFKMDVYYYSRRRDVESEKRGCTYLLLDNLLETVDILSIHLPKHTTLLNEDHFAKFGSNKILINTTLGLSFSVKDFQSWMIDKRNYAIMDIAGMGSHVHELSSLPNMISTPITSGFTREAKDRLAQKVIQNIRDLV